MTNLSIAIRIGILIRTAMNKLIHLALCGKTIPIECFIKNTKTDTRDNATNDITKLFQQENRKG